MGWPELLVLAVALAVDAFAVAAVTAFTLEDVTGRHAFRLSFHFGLFQALMLLAGWAFGSAAARLLASSDHWIACALLTLVGVRMIGEALRRSDDDDRPDRTRGWGLVVLSVATSIDALAVGLSLALVQIDAATPAIVVGIVAAALTLVGVVLGRRIGALGGRYVEVLGGVALIAIGLKIVLEHGA